MDIELEFGSNKKKARPEKSKPAESPNELDDKDVLAIQTILRRATGQVYEIDDERKLRRKGKA